MSALDNTPSNREQPETQLRNPNFRIPPPPPPPQNRKRDPRNLRNPKDQYIRPPFLENYVDEEEEEVDPIDNQIHHFDDLDT